MPATLLIAGIFFAPTAVCVALRYRALVSFSDFAWSCGSDVSGDTPRSLMSSGANRNGSQ